VTPFFERLCPAMTKEERKKQSKEAERRQTQCFMSAPAGAGRATERSACADPPLRARSPVGVPLTVLTRGLSPLRAAPGQASWDVAGALVCHFLLPEAEPNAVCAGVTRPNLSQSSGSTPPAARSGGLHDAQSRPGAGRNAARGHRTRSGLQVYLPKASFMSEIRVVRCN
jgi:hypothetical protein